jgi:hypothetical protein
MQAAFDRQQQIDGVGSLGATFEQSDDYRRGYLCGMVRGDGHIGSYAYDRPGRTKPMRAIRTSARDGV